MKSVKKNYLAILIILLCTMMMESLCCIVSEAMVVDWSMCPYCGGEAELNDDYTMFCPSCGYRENGWNCASESAIRQRTNSPYTLYSDFLNNSDELGSWVKISSGDVKHVLNCHTVSRVAQQYPFLTESEFAGKLKKSFFNPTWSDSLVSDSVNVAYNKALKKGLKTGEYSMNYMSETVIVVLNDGKFETGYGTYRYSVSEFKTLFCGES